MKTAATIALVCLVAMTAPAAAQRIEEGIATLTANGEGQAATVPDLMLITLGVTSRGATAREALAANSADMEALVTVIRDSGVADRDVATENFNIHPVYANERPQPDQVEPVAPKIVAYEVSNQVRLRQRDIDAAGGLLDRLVEAGANQVHSIQFSVDEPQALQDEATRAAVADARRKADLLAEAAGVRLVRLLRLDSGVANQPQFEARAMAMDAAVPISAGEQTITANATLTYEIAPAAAP